MSVKFDKLEDNKLKMTVEVPAEDFKKAIENSYKKTKSRYSVPGFRKGKVPRKMIEKMYGPVFMEDAINECMEKAYPAAYDEASEAGNQIMSRPQIGLEQAEEGKDLIFTATVALRPDCELGQYMGLEVEKVDVHEVTDEEVENAMKRDQEKNSSSYEVTDRAVIDGDRINLDFAGTVDGVAFDGGTSQGYDLTIGSGSFIPGFEEQLIGVGIGEEKDVVVTFPEDYQEASLAGKEAVFACKVNSITGKKVPELNDEFADLYTDFDTFEEYKASVKAQLEKNAADNADRVKGQACVAKAVENAKIDVCDEILDLETDRMMDEFASQMAQQGINMDMYMQYTGSNMDQMRATMRPEAEGRVKNRIVLEEIAKAEGIDVTDEMVEEEFKKMADMYGMDVDTIKNVINPADVKGDLAVQEVVKRMAASCVEVEKKEESADAE